MFQCCTLACALWKHLRSVLEVVVYWNIKASHLTLKFFKPHRSHYLHLSSFHHIYLSSCDLERTCHSHSLPELPCKFWKFMFLFFYNIQISEMKVCNILFLLFYIIHAFKTIITHHFSTYIQIWYVYLFAVRLILDCNVHLFSPFNLCCKVWHRVIAIHIYYQLLMYKILYCSNASRYVK